MKRIVSRKRWKNIRVLAMDVDGVLTDGSFYLSDDGSEIKRFSALDGISVRCVRKLGIYTVMISARASSVTGRRAKEMNIDYTDQSGGRKLDILVKLIEDLGYSGEQVCYIGDDDIDAEVIAFAGIGVSVPNGTQAARRAAAFVTRKRGGFGAVREVCDKILAAHHESILSLWKR